MKEVANASQVNAMVDEIAFGESVVFELSMGEYILENITTTRGGGRIIEGPAKVTLDKFVSQIRITVEDIEPKGLFDE